MKKLYRSADNKMLAGVCGGMAEYFEIDVTLLRLLFAFVVFFTHIFPGVFFYLVAALIIPAEKDDK